MWTYTHIPQEGVQAGVGELERFSLERGDLVHPVYERQRGFRFHALHPYPGFEVFHDLSKAGTGKGRGGRGSRWVGELGYVGKGGRGGGGRWANGIGM